MTNTSIQRKRILFVFLVLCLIIQVLGDTLVSLALYYRLPINFPTFIVKQWFPYVLLMLILVPPTPNPAKWRSLFNIKVWLLPLSVLFFASLIQVFSCNKINLSGGFWQFKWTWHAIATWTALFILQLFLYQRKVDDVHGFALSYCGVSLAGMLFELHRIRLRHLLTSRFILAFTAMTLLLHMYKLRLPKWSVILLAPCVLGWIFFSTLPFWLPRLTVYPLLLALPFYIQK